VPTVLVASEMDPATRPHWAEIAAQSLPNSVRVVVPGAGHTPETDCIAKVRGRLYETGSVKGLDLSCVPDMRRPGFALPGGAA
jgi:hypothetical protein